jgi:hypothetical protein
MSTLATVVASVLALALVAVLGLVLLAGARDTLRHFSPRLAASLFDLLFERVAMKRVPDFIVGDARDPYLLRWWILPRNRLCNVYLHCFMRSDDDRALHDHPWYSLSLALRGEVLEHSVGPDGAPSTRAIAAGAWRLRTATYAHRLELAAGAHCWTLFLTGPVLRVWGFHCPKGWVRWDVFTKTTPGRSVTGQGCGE